MIEKVCLLGSSAGRNAGDAALLSGIMEAIDTRLNRKLLYLIPSLYPDFVNRTYRQNNVKAVNVMPWTGSLKLMGYPTYRAVTQADLSLVFDAVLFDRALFNPMFNFLSSLAYLLPAAKKAGRKVGLYNCGVGPITTSLGERMLKKVCDSCDFITVREEGSAEVLSRIGVPDHRFIVTADAALNAPGQSDWEINGIFRQIGLDPNKEILAININKYLNSWSDQKNAKLSVSEFLDLMAESINRFGSLVDVPVLLVSTYHGDISLTQELASRLKLSQKVVVVDNKEFDHYQIKGLLAKVSMLFAMRLHAMILASSSCTPIAGLAYQPKVKHYFEQLGIGLSCTDFENFTADRLYHFLLMNWQRRQDTRVILEREIPRLQNKARIAADCVADLCERS